VAFHEFVKSVLLGARWYYKDEASPILNIFDCGAERNASHFTSLRIIKALAQRRGELTREGQGYVEISRLVSMTEDLFDNREDMLRALNRLVGRQLIEANTKSTESIVGASHVRVTSSGWYFRRYLVKAFSYIDLVLQDTPINEIDVERRLRTLVQQVDNLADRQEEKLARMQVRFERVRTFLKYLRSEEDKEQDEFDLSKRGGIWAERFIPDIEAQIEREIEWIQRRLEQNREKVVDDLHVEADEEEIEVMEYDEPDEDPDTSAIQIG
jgi:hypothetical protein